MQIPFAFVHIQALCIKKTKKQSQQIYLWIKIRFETTFVVFFYYFCNSTASVHLFHSMERDMQISFHVPQEIKSHTGLAYYKGGGEMMAEFSSLAELCLCFMTGGRYNAYVYRVSNHKEAVHSWMSHELGCGVLVFETWGQSLGLAVPYALSHRSVPGLSVRKLWYGPFGRPTKTPSTNILSNQSETALHL